MAEADELAYRGFVINRADPDHPYDLIKVDGLRGAAVRSGDTPIPRGDGDTPGSHWLEAKRPVLTVDAFGDYHDVVPPLVAAFQPSRSVEHPLVWREGGEEVRLYCRPVDVPVTRQASRQGATEVAIALKAADPRVYGQLRTVQVEPFKLAGGAVNDPVDDPKDATAEGGTDETVHNGGASDAHPQMTVSGPDSGSADGVRLTNRTNGSQIEVSTSVGPGQTLVVRMREWVTRRLDTFIVELDGANRYDDWTTRGEVFYLSPGDNVVRLEVLGGTDTGVKATLSYRDTYDGERRDD